MNGYWIKYIVRQGTNLDNIQSYAYDKFLNNEVSGFKEITSRMTLVPPSKKIHEENTKPRTIYVKSNWSL